MDSYHHRPHRPIHHLPLLFSYCDARSALCFPILLAWMLYDHRPHLFVFHHALLQDYIKIDGHREGDRQFYLCFE